MDIIKKIAQEIGCRDSQVEAAVKLIDEGNTIPFIARYRKEATGSLNDEQLRLLHERLVYLRNLEDKKAQVIASIEEQGKLTDQLRADIEKAETMVLVDDLYRPYRPKRKTRATIAKDKGLEGLANIIMLQMTRTPIVKEAEAYVSEEKGVADTSEAIAGAMDIIAENISDTADYRTHIRDLTTRHGVLRTTAKDPEAESVYEMYYDFSTPVSKMTGYRTLAVNRGEKEKFITVKIEAPVNDIISYLKKQIIVRDNPETEQILSDAIADRYESDGIRKIVSVLSLIIDAYNEQSCTIAIDELDAGVFEYLLGEVLQTFQESGKGQFIFTSHNLRPLEFHR